MASELYIGALSGTSRDAKDICLVEIEKTQIKLLKFKTYKFEKKLKNLLFNINNLEDLVKLDIQLGKSFAKSIEKFLIENNIEKKKIKAIGFHGQTVFHKDGYTLQIGEPSFISNLGIDVVYDFRRTDISVGGTGAPLSPVLHYLLFRSEEESVLFVNIGGISNVTFIPKKANFSGVVAFDTGPGNIILDEVSRRFFKKDYDKDGKIASKGKVHKDIVEIFLKEKFFRKKPPKSAGKEIEEMSNRFINFCTSRGLKPEDIMATALQLTVESVKASQKFLSAYPDKVILSGGGANNKFMKKRFCESFRNVETTENSAIAIKPKEVESVLFSYLAYLYVNRIPLNLKNITGAKKEVVLGKLSPSTSTSIL